jgi:protein SCO1/2
MLRKNNFLLLFIILFGAISCTDHQEKDSLGAFVLPILGPKSVIEGDTVYHTIGKFSFTDQNREEFTEAKTKGRIYITDFFFTSCPVQCPKMSSQMKRLATNIADLDDVMFVSHAIDYVRDSVDRINDYRVSNGLEFDNWYFLEAREMYTNDVAMNEYLLLSKEDVEAAGGYAHSPLFALIDKEGRIRGYYDGQETEEVDQLERDLRKLIEFEYGVSPR